MNPCDYYDVLNSSSTEDDDSFHSIPSISDILTSNFTGVPGTFNAVHVNAQSIPAHITDMQAVFDCKNLHAILVSESWLKPQLPTTLYSIPGYRLVRNDRTEAGGGGVAIYLQSSLKFKIIDMSPHPVSSNAGEHLFLEVELNNIKILLGVYYCPSLRVDFFSSFENLLHKFNPSYSHTILMGDFNTCLLKNNTRSLAFKTLVESCNLSILPLNATHRFPNSCPSLLDLIIVSSVESVAKHGQCPADCFSYHDLIFVSYKVRPPKIKPKILQQRNFNGINHDHLLSDAGIIDWSTLLNSNDINEKVEILTNNLTTLYDKHAPVRHIKIKHVAAPWLTKDIKELLRRKAAAKTRYKYRPCNNNWDKYVQIRNRCNKVCRDAQRRHIHDSVQKSDPAKVWKFLKSLGVGKQNTISVPSDLDVNQLNNFFTSTSIIDEITKQSTIGSLSSLPTPKYAPFVFSQLTDCEVKKSLVSITSKAIGSDSVSRKMILPILDAILPIITHILNFSLTCSVFPSSWKDAHITPIPKKTNPKVYSDYRPISILPFLSKVLERLVHSQLSCFLNKNCLLNPYQSGFRPGHSTVTALIKITDDIKLAAEEGNVTVLALLDFSNAFNTVNYDILLTILSSLNMSPVVIDWFCSYLSGRRQRIQMDGISSTWCNITTGVPQGGVLSPLLFAIFINSISLHLRCSYHLYADDLQIYTNAPIAELHNAIANINDDLAYISAWSNNYGLKVNPDKTQAIVTGSSRMIARLDWAALPPIMFNGVRVAITDVVKDLGIYIDKTMSWGTQLKITSQKIFASAASLRRLQYFLPTATKIELAQSLLLPILDYGDICYLDINQSQLDKLERLQNFCIRFIFGLRKYDHVSEFRTKLKWLPIRLRRNAHVLSLLYNILFDPRTPTYLKEHFLFFENTSSRSYRSSEQLRLRTPVNTTQFYAKSFVVKAVQLWNSLPTEIRAAQSIHTFNNQVKEYYLTL